MIEAGKASYERSVADGEAEQARLVSQTEVVQAAHAESARVIDAAHAESDRLRSECDEYVDSKLAEFEEARMWNSISGWKRCPRGSSSPGPSVPIQSASARAASSPSRTRWSCT
jgi:hypothetical protein